MAADNYERLQLFRAPKCGGERQPSAAREPWSHPAQRRTRDADELVLVADFGRWVGVREATQHAGDGGREGVRQHLFFRERKKIKQIPLRYGIYYNRRRHCMIYRSWNAYYKNQ